MSALVNSQEHPKQKKSQLAELLEVGSEIREIRECHATLKKGKEIKIQRIRRKLRVKIRACFFEQEKRKTKEKTARILTFFQFLIQDDLRLWRIHEIEEETNFSKNSALTKESVAST